ncbi:MAG: histidine kinase [Clostridium sp.]
MNKKIETWCYGGQSKAFFGAQSEAIHEYNTKMMDRLLLVMTFILGCYVATEACFTPVPHYLVTYLVCFIVLLTMLCIFKLKADKSRLFTRTYIVLFDCIMFALVCLLGTVFEPNSRAIMFIVYLLAMPMFFVIPTHCTYGFLITATCIFSAMSLWLKDFEYARMDISHGLTCLVIGIFTSHHILESRMALYALNDQLDERNMKLDEDLQEKEQQLLQSRISILLSQIQPHFLYNTLTVICGLCDENPKEAKNVTAQFADYLRHNLDTLNQRATVPFEDELRHTRVYLGIEQKRFEEKLRIVYDLETTDFRIPALTMQPLVENAVKHGVLKRKKGGTVTIATRKYDSYCEITITDDGVGFDPSKPPAEPDSHIGIENVRDRLHSMCGGALIIQSKVGNGTTATIQIPKGDTNL